MIFFFLEDAAVWPENLLCWGARNICTDLSQCDVMLYGMRYVIWCDVLGDVIPDSKIRGASMGPIWDRQDPGGSHVGPMNFVIWDVMWCDEIWCDVMWCARWCDVMWTPWCPIGDKSSARTINSNLGPVLLTLKGFLSKAFSRKLDCDWLMLKRISQPQPSFLLNLLVLTS